jgi:hypothetical protein
MQIALSQLKAHGFADEAAFSAAVAAHLAAHREHQQTVGVAAPSPASSIIEHAVRRVQYPIDAGKPDDFVADFEVIDDTPPPPSLEERKMALAVQVQAAATQALHAFTPPLKARMLNLQVAEAAVIDETKRTSVQRALLADAESRAKRELAVHRHWAELESQIHDLTEATIDQWKPAPFPE